MDVSIVGDFKKGKELMKAKRAESMKQIRKLERKHEKLNLPPAKEVKELEALQKTIPFYSVSVTTPAKYENVIINGKLVLNFIKKLKGFHYDITTTDDSLKLSYGRKLGEWTGELELFDLSSYFEGFTDIPKLEVYNFLD